MILVYILIKSAKGVYFHSFLQRTFKTTVLSTYAHGLKINDSFQDFNCSYVPQIQVRFYMKHLGDRKVRVSSYSTSLLSNKRSQYRYGMKLSSSVPSTGIVIAGKKQNKKQNTNICHLCLAFEKNIQEVFIIEIHSLNTG